MTGHPHGLTVPQGAALTMGAVIGTGVLSLPGLAAEVAGPASLVSWLAMVLLSVPLSATFGALGARFPDGGGVAHYARMAFGDRASTVIGWCFYFAIPLGAPPAAGFAGAYVADTLGAGRGAQLATAAAMIVAVSVLNWFGIRISANAQLAIAGGLALLLAVATVVSLPHASMANLTPFAPHGWAAVGAAAALLVWAFAGWEVVTSLSMEYRDPRRDIPRATLVALVFVAALYLGVAFATVAVLGSHPGAAPLSDLLVLGFGAAARPVTTLVAVLLSMGAMNAYFAGISRLGAALGRDGSLPAWFAQGHESGGTPRRSMMVVSGLALMSLAVLALTGLAPEWPMLFVTGSLTLVYVIGSAAALRLLPRRSLVWWAALVSLVATCVLLVLTGWHLVAAFGIALVALVWHGLRGRGRAAPAAASSADEVGPALVEE